MIAIVDYDIGNIRSVFKAFEHLGIDVVSTRDGDTITGADGVVLPGVAAFGDAMDHLRALDLVEPLQAVNDAGTPFLGICVGMQVLFQESNEMGQHQGLGFLAGRVRRFDDGVRVPQIGWNQVRPRQEDPILKGFRSGSWAYFAHSYYAKPADPDVVLTETEYGITYPSMVKRGNLYGIQFHPEKSQQVGLRILSNFAALVASVLDDSNTGGGEGSS